MPFEVSYWPVGLTDKGWQQTEGIFCESVVLREGILPTDGEIVCPSRGGRFSPWGQLKGTLLCILKG